MIDSSAIMDITDNQIPASTEDVRGLLHQYNADHKNEELRQKLLDAISKHIDLLTRVGTSKNWRLKRETFCEISIQGVFSLV